MLLQSGKAGDLASTFGGGGSQTAFGTRSATSLLTRFTAVGAALFMVTCLILAGWAKRGESSVMTNTPTSTAPAEATGAEGTGSWWTAPDRARSHSAPRRREFRRRWRELDRELGSNRAGVVEYGRHTILRGWRSNECAGSNPASGTNCPRVARRSHF